jgi:hypothetical protein
MPPSRFGGCVWPTASKAVVDVTVKGWPEMALKIPLICQSLAFCPTEFSMLIFTKRIIYRSFPGAALFCGFVEDRFGFGIPVDSFPGPIGARRHHAGYGVRESAVHGCIGLFARGSRTRRKGPRRKHP